MRNLTIEIKMSRIYSSEQLNILLENFDMLREDKISEVVKYFPFEDMIYINFCDEQLLE